MIGNIGSEVGIEPVGAAQHVVLQAKLFDSLVALALLPQLGGQDIGGLQPQRAVLLIGIAPVRQRLHCVSHIAAVVKGRLEEPLVVLNAVAGQIGLHLGDIDAETELGQGVMAGLFVAVQILIALILVESLGQLPDIVAVVAVLGEFHRVLALDDLEVPGLQTLGELFDLVARVVDVELTPHVRTGLLQHAGQSVSQHAAPGVAHVHGAGGIGGDKLHHVLPASQRVVLAVLLPCRLNAGDGVGEPLATQAEVHKAGTGDLHGGEIAVRQRRMVDKRLGYLTGVHLHSLGRRQAEGGGIVAVGGVLGDLHRRLGGDTGRQQPCGRSLFICSHCQLPYLRLGAFDHIHASFSSFVKVSARCRADSACVPSSSVYVNVIWPSPFRGRCQDTSFVSTCSVSAPPSPPAICVTVCR